MIITDLLGTPTEIGEKQMREEIWYQTGLRPVRVARSKLGADEQNRITWILSFQEQPQRCNLFNEIRMFPASRRRALGRHDPGCQQYCESWKCTREAVCRKCARPLSTHEPAGDCNHPTQCAGCRGPFPADHDNCPTKPQRVNGKTVRPDRKQIQIIRRAGEISTTIASAPAVTVQIPVPVQGRKRKSRTDAVSRYEDGSNSESDIGGERANDTSGSSTDEERDAQGQRITRSRAVKINKNLNLEALSNQAMTGGHDTTMEDLYE